MHMTKDDAKNLFGNRFTDLANALGIGKSAVSQWPDVLDETRKNTVIGAAVRKGIKIPAELLK
jgi:UTP--glucose-1-phosphate uridylyltransferase